MAIPTSTSKSALETASGSDIAVDLVHGKIPAPFCSSPATSFELVTQGAEALVFKTCYLTNDTPVALKVRPRKSWRHAALDRRLTRQRILAEARVLVKCRRDGVPVPAILGLDWERGWLVSEWIDGTTVKDSIRCWSAGRTGTPQTAGSADGALGDLEALLDRIGKCLGVLHAGGVVHGDLTTSNMMIRKPEAVGGDGSELAGEIVLIDFGLATQTVQDEDRAVDLYVLERAFGSTHPKEECLFPRLLDAYASSFRGATAVLRRLEDVRLRGRKKSMIG